jgi:hypothetical protein
MWGSEDANIKILKYITLNWWKKYLYRQEDMYTICFLGKIAMTLKDGQTVTNTVEGRKYKFGVTKLAKGSIFVDIKEIVD